MNITLTSLEALILKATHEALPCPDSAAIEAFCSVMKDAPEGPQYAAQALAARIHSSNSREAMLTLTMLDSCMRRCDPNFHAEVGKFRFLNEMIKLVSPKYFSDKTPQEVRTRILQYLHAWSIEYPKESKFKVAYEMLKNQGVVKETPPPLPPEDGMLTKIQPKNAIFEDEEKSKLLQKLLQSKKPEDLQHANRLIKTMVREEERRNEANSRRAQEVSAALDSSGLLRDMLQHASDASPDEEQLIHELHASCARLRPVLQRLAIAETQNNGSLDDILHASDVLDEVFEKYKEFVSEKKKNEPKCINIRLPNGGTLLDFAGSMVSIRSVDNKEHVSKKINALDELGDIFATGSNNANIAEPLKPVSLIVNDDTDLLAEKTTKAEGWNELDSLSEQLLKQSLPDNARRLDGFNSKNVKKVPMNAIEKAIFNPSEDTASSLNNSAMLDLDFFIKKEKTPKDDIARLTNKSPSELTPSNDDIMVDISIEKDINKNRNSILDVGCSVEDKNDDNIVTKNELKNILKNEPKCNKNSKQSDVKPLTDIVVTLDSIKPSKISPITAFDEDGGISVLLYFCEDKPREDVNVVVVSTTSKNTSPIEDYKFQAVVPKGCKVHLLAPSGSSLLAYNPFLPPPALTQVMLIARPSLLPVINLKFIITYTCDNETCSEMGEVKALPVNDI